MQAYEYQEQYPEPPPPGFGSDQAPADNPPNKKVKAGSCVKCIAISDITISSICASMLIGVVAAGYIFWPVLLLLIPAYTGSIVASVLILLTQPKKMWVAVFWVIWNTLRVSAEICAPFMGFVLDEYTPKAIAFKAEGRGGVFGYLGGLITVIAWGIIEFFMLGTYITFLVFIGRYWRSFCGPKEETGMEFQPPPTAPYGQPPYVEQPPEYQYQNPPPPQN